ncbi:NUDIX domain-containing protein [Catenovulum sp. SX2]|uniref:NUDIX domain-containing protein n=1 Tax=Catenovulum sp. SX2 TaxID=3398614 RepID=UPI003F824233
MTTSQLSTKVKARVSLIIVNPENEILLIKRRKDNRVYWVFPGGGVEDGESLADAAIRETLEETSHKLVNVLPLFCLLNHGRQEHFYLSFTEKFDAKLGLGPELETQNPLNRYELIWASISGLAALPLVPNEAKELVFQWYLP